MNALAVVVLNYNGAQHLRRFLPFVIQYTPSEVGDVYVVDNASTDDSCSVVREHIALKRLLRLPRNQGYAGGYNEALRQIKATYYVLLNNDVQPSPGWLLPLRRSMERQQIAACQPKVRAYRNRTHFDYAGAAGGYIDRLGYTFCRGRIVNTIEEDRGQYDRPQSIFWASGACFGVRADAYWRVGGLDEHFFMHMEEVDLCWRLQRAGYHIQYCPNSLVFHLGAGTLKSSSATKTYYNFRNNWLMLAKNLSISQLIWLLPLRMLLDLGALCYYLLTAQWPKANGLCRAYLYCLTHPLKGIQLRQQANLIEKKTLKQPLSSCFLIGEYFFRNKKTYTDIFLRKFK